MWDIVYKSKIADNIEAKIAASFEDLLIRDDLGFMRVELIEQAAKDSLKLMQEMEPTEKIAIFGIGGSSLGTQALCAGLFPETWRNKISFFDNVDARSLDAQLANISDPENYTWVIVSKSGNTIESLTVYDFCHQYFFNNRQCNIAQKTVVITEKKPSPLYDFASEHNLPVLDVPRSVGGRYSVFSAVGLFPLALMGANIDNLVEGAKSGLNDQNFITQMAGELLSSMLRSEFNLYIFCYSDRMTVWSGWLQQLWAESMAKHLNRDGELAPLVSTLIPCRGATDQHSILQQMAEGREKKFVCFVREDAAEKGLDTLARSHFKNELMVGKNIGQLLSAEVHATADALLEKGVQSTMLKCKSVDEKSMAHMMAAWMMVVGTLGEAYNINAYDQPGVESGKILARRVLSGTV